MKKLFTTLCLAVVGLLATIPIHAEEGDTFNDENYRYIILSESVDANEVGLIGWVKYPEGVVEIPETVLYEGQNYTITQIGYEGIGPYGEELIYSPFQNCRDIREVKLPGSITSINRSAFALCTSLVSVSTTASEIRLGAYAFHDCVSLEIFTGSLGNLIEQYSFYNCTSLSSIKFGNTLKSIGSYVFYGCHNLKGITSLPYGVETIGFYCFGYCESLEEMTLPETLTYIGGQAFSDSGIKTFVLPSSIIEWGRNGGYTPFSRCPVENLTIDSEALISLFRGSTTLRNVTIGNSISSIPDNSFSQCSNLTNLILGTSVTSIGDNAFSSCALSDIEFNSSLTFIGNGSFSNNPITGLSIPKNIKSIGYGAFFGCPIETLYINSSADLNYVFSYDMLTKAVFNDDATTIPSFRGASKLCDMTLPSPMTALPDDAFVNCVSLKTLNLPGGLQSIGNYAFSGCTGLTVELPSSLQKIGNFSFLGCISLSELEIPANVTSIGSGAFSNCSSLQVMRLPENLTSISSNLFANCIGLEKVYFSENVNSFGANAFQNCSSLRSLIIPDGVESIPQGMMQNCTSLTEILIPNSVETISQNAFQGCTSLKNIDLGTGMYTIGDYAFADCPNITDIHSMALNPPIAESYTFPTKAYTNATVTVREQSLSTYNRENPWYRFQNYLTVSGAISLSHYNVDMAGNEVFQLGVYGSDSEIKWSSSNPAVAYANDCGLIVAMGITGATVITATVDGEEINCNVTVSSPYRDPQAYTRSRAASEEEDLQPVDIIMEGVGGNPPMVNVRLVPVGSKTIIDWTSSNPSLATVQNGIVTVIADGDVDFGVETENGLEETLEIDTKNIDTTGIEEIFNDTDVMMPMNVYDLSGRIIYFNATLEQIKNLDKGLYIIKGKKVMIK